MTKPPQGARRIDYECGTPLSARRTELPDLYRIYAGSNRLLGQQKPSTMLEALMETVPGGVPTVSTEEGHALSDAIDETLQALAPEQLWLVDMLVYARLSLRFLAIVTGIPKTTLARRRDAIYADIAEILLEKDVVREYLGIATD